MIELPALNASEPHVVIHLPTREATFNETAPVASFRSRAVKFFTAAACIAFVSFLATSGLQSYLPVSSVENAKEVSTNSAPHFDLRTHEPLKFHQSGFGALNFHHHEDGITLSRRYLQATNVQVPKSAVSHAVQSIAAPNIVNLQGHYFHDEHRSPWASGLYDRPNEELEQEQKEYVEKMNKVREEHGFWSFKDHSNVVRPVQDFSKIEYKDIKNTAWQQNVWQTDEQYVKDFIAEGRKLVDRMLEGIHAEYGFPAKKADGSTLTDEELTKKEQVFKVNLIDNEVGVGTRITPVRGGAGWITHSAFDGLTRKLLHSMITNDEFYYVLGGHSAAAGHGNNHPRQSVMVRCQSVFAGKRTLKFPKYFFLLYGFSLSLY